MESKIDNYNENVLEYEKKINKENYLIKILLNNSSELLLEIYLKNSFPEVVYKIAHNLSELKELNKAFRIYDTLEDIYNCINGILEEGNYNISFKHEIIILSISIYLPNGKRNIINFELIKEKIDKDKLIKTLCQKINKLEKEIISIKESEANKEARMNDMLKRLNILEEKEKQREEKEKEDLEEKENSRLKDIKESSICNGNEISLFLSEFQLHKKFFNKKIIFKLLYKATRDGDKIKNFHNNCDYKDSILILIESKNGARFGGYSEIGFNDKGSDVKDNNAFVFSLNKMLVYKAKYNENHIYCEKKLFGFKNTIYIYDDFLSKKNNINLGGYSNYPCEANELNNNEEKFSCEEIEIYQIIGE